MEKQLTIIVIVYLLLTILFGIWSIAEADIVVECVAYEASGEPYQGQVAVASVIKTRAHQRGLTLEQVVTQKGQFSCFKDGKPTQGRQLSTRELKVAERALKEAEISVYNHYARYDCKPYWVKHAKKSKRIGDHVFYAL